MPAGKKRFWNDLGSHAGRRKNLGHAMVAFLRVHRVFQCGGRAGGDGRGTLYRPMILS